MFGLFGNTFVYSKRYGDRMFHYEKLCFATIENPRVGGSNPPPWAPSLDYGVDSALLLACRRLVNYAKMAFWLANHREMPTQL